MFAIRTLVKNPDVITQKVEPGQQEVSFTTASQSGDFYLVHPATTQEILFVMFLAHRDEKFAPARGNGVLIRKSLLA
jgi:hypothetical protein